MAKTNWLLYGIIGIVALVGLGFIKLPAFSTVGTPTVESQQGCYGMSFSGLTLSTYLPYSGSNSSTVNAIIYSDDSNIRASADSDTASANPKAISTSLGTVFGGKMFVGNDNYWGSDRGTEYYYAKQPLSWNCKADPTYRVELYPESTMTLTGYDDGTTESSLNVTVGTTTIYTTEMKIASATAGCVGNKQLTNPIAVCFNATGTGIGSSIADWDAIKPATNYISGTISVPGFLAGRNIVGAQCYVLNAQALCDGADYRFSITLDPGASDIAATSQLTMFVLDKTYTEQDDGTVVEGFGDESNLAADTDIGISAFANEKTIGVA